MKRKTCDRKKLKVDIWSSTKQQNAISEAKSRRECFIRNELSKYKISKDDEGYKQIVTLLEEIYDINTKKTQSIDLYISNKNATSDSLITEYKKRIDIWKELYGREITSGSFSSNPLPWRYVKSLLRYFLNPTNAAIFVLLFTFYATYYWLRNQSLTLSLATDTVSTIIQGTMAFMLTMTLSSGKSKEQEIIKKFEALSGDIKAMAMYLVHATYDHEKYKMSENGKLVYDNRVRDQFHKMQYLLAILSPTARKVLQGSHSFLFPEYLGDSGSWFTDLVNGKISINKPRYFFLWEYGLILSLLTLGFISLTLVVIALLLISESIPYTLIYTLILFGIGLFIFATMTRWTDCRLCGWGCCCKSTPYADVDDLELIPFTKPRNKNGLNFLYAFCCLSTKYKRNYRRWSDESCMYTKKTDEYCTKGLELALYNKIKETQRRTGMDLFETEMTVLLDEINRIGELKIGFGEDEGSAILSAVLNKWEGIYGSWGEMSSVKTYSEPTLIQLYRVFFMFMYAFITPIKYLSLHENNNNWCLFDCDQKNSVDPYIWWSVLDVSVYAFMWWVAYYVRNPFDKSLWFGRSEIIVGISTSTQKQVNRFLINGKQLEQEDYRFGYRYGWGGTGNNAYPIGYKDLRYPDNENRTEWGEPTIKFPANITLKSLDRLSGNMFKYSDLIQQMLARYEVYTPKFFKIQLAKYARITNYTEDMLDQYVSFYKKDYDELEKNGDKVVSRKITLMGESVEKNRTDTYRIVDTVDKITL